jgi:uncharacterized protein YndB with AHSA1/START domain
MTEIPKIPSIEHRVYIRTPPEKVYEALTTAEGWDAWFTQGTEVDARPGGRIIFRWMDFGVNHYTSEAGGPVLEADPPRRFVFQWTPGDSTTTIEFDLEPLSPGTVLTVTESGHAMTEKDLAALVDCAAGWGEALTLLKMYFEYGLTYSCVPDKGT